MSHGAWDLVQVGRRHHPGWDKRGGTMHAARRTFERLRGHHRDHYRMAPWAHKLRVPPMDHWRRMGMTAGRRARLGKTRTVECGL
jgi:hypothetical protein